jgi:hypothetical protein
MDDGNQQGNSTYGSQTGQNPHDVPYGNPDKAIGEVLKCNGYGETRKKILNILNKHGGLTDQVKGFKNLPGKSVGQGNSQETVKTDMKYDGQDEAIEEGGQPSQAEKVFERDYAKEKICKEKTQPLNGHHIGKIKNQASRKSRDIAGPELFLGLCSKPGSNCIGKGEDE